ncbi:DUF6998 domain-containing protein [Sphingorhabdus sp. M41]|uniref:DUF6998 domain-containing protein n=1 Tax=Sphingorhabdus sp. M41 TaxID=1806885 RepID=UPI00078B6C5F|nr:hypothetical protein [Sphingorhabdus sp. M41]AMO70653.1 hypothetical protein AZE99_01225 [Sphingorhabdus sp. M41]
MAIPPAIDHLSIRGLMQLGASIGVELRKRKICRTSNSPIGDVAEYLFSETFGWNLAVNSKAGFDAITQEGKRIQIKSRRVWAKNTSRQAGDIRNLSQHLFDELAGVVFDENYSVILAIIIPHHLVLEQALEITHSNSHRIYLRDDWVARDGVRDVTAVVRQKWEQLNSTLYETS